MKKKNSVGPEWWVCVPLRIFNIKNIIFQHDKRNNERMGEKEGRKKNSSKNQNRINLLNMSKTIDTHTHIELAYRMELFLWQTKCVLLFPSFKLVESSTNTIRTHISISFYRIRESLIKEPEMLFLFQHHSLHGKSFAFIKQIIVIA